MKLNNAVGSDLGRGRGSGRVLDALMSTVVHFMIALTFLLTLALITDTHNRHRRTAHAPTALFIPRMCVCESVCVARSNGTAWAGAQIYEGHNNELNMTLIAIDRVVVRSFLSSIVGVIDAYGNGTWHCGRYW